MLKWAYNLLTLIFIHTFAVGELWEATQAVMTAVQKKVLIKFGFLNIYLYICITNGRVAELVDASDLKSEVQQ